MNELEIARPRRHVGNAVFKMIVEMAYEMKYANRHCEAKRSNTFIGLPKRFDKIYNRKEKLPFEEEEIKFEKIRLGDIVILPVFFSRDNSLEQEECFSRTAKVVRLNKKSVSISDCDQDGKLVEYSTDNFDYNTKQELKDHNKLFSGSLLGFISIIKGTKHKRYDGWDS